MRVVYDDTHAQTFRKLLEIFLGGVNLKEITKYDYGMNRIQRHLFKEELECFVSTYKFSIGNKATHKNGISNNALYPVFFTEKLNGEIQECCYIAMNTDMYSGMYVYLEDYYGNLFGFTYKVTPRGISIERK